VGINTSASPPARHVRHDLGLDLGQAVLNNLVRNPYAAGLLIDGIDGAPAVTRQSYRDAMSPPLSG